MRAAQTGEDDGCFLVGLVERSALLSAQVEGAFGHPIDQQGDAQDIAPAEITGLGFLAEAPVEAVPAKWLSRHEQDVEDAATLGPGADRRSRLLVHPERQELLETVTGLTADRQGRVVRSGDLPRGGERALKHHLRIEIGHERPPRSKQPPHAKRVIRSAHAGPRVVPVAPWAKPLEHRGDTPPVARGSG